MLELKTKQKLAIEAHNLARGSEMVRYRNTTYIPADFETRDTSVVPDVDRTIWLPLTRAAIRKIAASQFDTLFASDSELSSFDFMVGQTAEQIDDAVSSLLVRTPQGLRELNDQGLLVPATGEFRPNALLPMLNEDDKLKAEIFALVSTWLDSDTEAESLLRHLATSLAPGWSAVKYVLLLGEGRNGKGLLMKMVHALFGNDNVSSVTRQAMAEQNPVVTELNGKLLNLVYDGQAEYLKDSGTEKTLIAGEPAPIRRLYESTATIVQTNALFVEGLNHEPKSKDKSPALQKRLVRYHFPNVYPLNKGFEKKHLTQEMLGAFLSLLIDHYVTEDSVAVALAPTTRTLELQLEAMFANSMGLQFIKHIEEHDTFGAAGLVGANTQELVAQFQSWRLKENDIGQWAEPDILALFQPLINTERKSIRVNGKVRKVRIITSYKAEAAAFIETLKGESDDAELLEALVDD